MEYKTKPWAADEFIIVDSHPLPYRVERGAKLVVVFPGGIAEPLDSVVASGANVVMPLVIRRNTETVGGRIANIRQSRVIERALDRANRCDYVVERR